LQVLFGLEIRKALIKIAGKGEIMGDILNPIIPIEEDSY